MAEKVLHVAAVQLKFRRTLPENVEIIGPFVADAARGGSDVVLFPECALTGYNVDFREVAPRDVEDGLKAVADAARAYRCHVLVGSPTFTRGRWFNSLVVFDRRGRETFRYHKIHQRSNNVCIKLNKETIESLPRLFQAQLNWFINEYVNRNQ